MEFKQVIGSRRSIRFYQPWRPVEREKIQACLEAGRLASRAVNAPFAKAVVLYRDQLTEEQRNSLKTPTTTAQLDLAPVWIIWHANLGAITDTKLGATLKQLIDVGALTPSHGWSYSYAENVVWAQMLKPINDDPNVLVPVVFAEASLAICQSLLCAVDEGLGTQLTAVTAEAVKRIVKTPDTWVPIWAQLLGYPAESREAGGQRPREPFEEDFFEMEYGKPFRRDPKVVEALEAVGMIRSAAPFPWRKDEVRALSRAFELPE